MFNTSRNNLKTKNKVIFKVLSFLFLIGLIISSVYLTTQFNNEYTNAENDFRTDIISLSAPMIEEVESLYADTNINDKTISGIITPVLESNENIALVRVWNKSGFMQIAGYRLPTGVVASTPEDPVPSINATSKIKDMFSGKNQQWELTEIDALLNILNQQQAISDEYESLLKPTKIDLELRSEIYNMQNLLMRGMPALIKKYPDLSDAQDFMNQSSDALEMDTKEDISAGQGYSEDAISIISSVLENYRASKAENINVIPNELSYIPAAETWAGNLYPKIKCEEQFIPITRPAVNENMVEVVAVVEIITIKRKGDFITFWTWQWGLVPLCILLSITFMVLSRKKKTIEENEIEDDNAGNDI